jgi:hypothetical protein
MQNIESEGQSRGLESGSIVGSWLFQGSDEGGRFSVHND